MLTAFSSAYFEETAKIARLIDCKQVERIAELLAQARSRGGRAFFIGVGGGAGHASHAVCDFRKLAGIECYAPTDNVSEITARTNDDGWESVFSNWLRTSRLREDDLVFVFSVGGGDIERNVSPNLVRALELAKERKAKIVGVVGKDGGYVARVADACVIVPTVNKSLITPHTESFQAVIWHLLISHPQVKTSETKWESIQK